MPIHLQYWEKTSNYHRIICRLLLPQKRCAMHFDDFPRVHQNNSIQIAVIQAQFIYKIPPEVQSKDFPHTKLYCSGRHSRIIRHFVWQPCRYRQYLNLICISPSFLDTDQIISIIESTSMSLHSHIQIHTFCSTFVDHGNTHLIFFVHNFIPLFAVKFVTVEPRKRNKYCANNCYANRRKKLALCADKEEKKPSILLCILIFTNRRATSEKEINIITE